MADIPTPHLDRIELAASGRTRDYERFEHGRREHVSGHLQMGRNETIDHLREVHDVSPSDLYGLGEEEARSMHAEAHAGRTSWD